jgi:hypothetical protein
MSNEDLTWVIYFVAVLIFGLVVVSFNIQLWYNRNIFSTYEVHMITLVSMILGVYLASVLQDRTYTITLTNYKLDVKNEEEQK